MPLTPDQIHADHLREARPTPVEPEARCDRVVNNGFGEPTECGRTQPCEYHDEVAVEPDGLPLDVLARKIADRMAQSYRLSTTRAADVATALDEVIDQTGNLLGWLREYARLGAPSEDEQPR